MLHLWPYGFRGLAAGNRIMADKNDSFADIHRANLTVLCDNPIAFNKQTSLLTLMLLYAKAEMLGR